MLHVAYFHGESEFCLVLQVISLLLVIYVALLSLQSNTLALYKIASV